MKLFAMSLVGLLALGFAAASPARAEVNEKILTEVYHQGLKSFYAGRYAEANETLSQAIDGGTKDPRPYYIRGIANLRLGRTANAQADFQAGAAIEGHDFDLFYNVSKALERIQGNERKMLESYRAAGRKNALAEVEKVRFQLYRRFNPGEGVVGAATTTSGAGGAAGQASAGTDPNAPAATGAAPANNPFGGAAPAPTAPNNPFGGGAPAATPPAAAPPAAAPPTNPFGT
jgi:tetratricopeptide (TPR) repeat protein